nr:hypothetical protein HK105_006485 [Polyrhizophydium stewartii]
MLERVDRLGWHKPQHVLHAAARNCWLDLLDFTKPKKLCRLAVDSGALWLVRMLVDEDETVELGSDHIERAAAAGHVEILKYIAQRTDRSDWVGLGALDGAARNGHLEAVQWLHRKGMCSRHAMREAAEGGHVEAMRWLQRECTGVCRLRPGTLSAEITDRAVLDFIAEASRRADE